MNILLWVLQALLAFHTVIGAVWKFSHSAQETMPSLAAIPQVVWLAMSGFEILCAIGLVIPLLVKSAGVFVPLSASLIAAEMVLFCVMHLSSGAADKGPMIYWLVVAGICTFIAYGRYFLKPL